MIHDQGVCFGLILYLECDFFACIVLYRKVRTLHGSFLSHLELGQKLKKLKDPFPDVIFRFQSTFNYNW